MVFTATMEDSGDDEDPSNPRHQEKNWFQNIEETEKDDPNMNHTLNNATVVSTPSRSAYLFWQNGVPGIEAADKAVGPAIALEVKEGDILTAKAFARYENKVGGYPRNGITLSVLSSLLGNSFNTMAGFEGKPLAEVNQLVNTALGAGAFLDDDDEGIPFAYINYIVFDAGMVRIDSKRQRISVDAGFDPPDAALQDQHEEVKFPEDIAIGSGGKYIYLWVSNESENTKVWFDDFTVTHTSNFVAQATDYGVWGDVLREQRSEWADRYRYGYQGNFSEHDEETSWNHFEAREYDAVIGRWTSKDPARQFHSPYGGMGNNPVSNVDPDGRRIIINRFLRRDLVYENGSIYNMDGSAYTGRVGGFLGKRFDALNNLNSVSEGASRLRTLENSPFDFIIERGANKFIPNNIPASAMALNAQVSGTAIPAGVTVGSGGIIKWRPGDFRGDLNSAGSNQRPSLIGLGHELLGHAYTASQGMTDWRRHSSGLFSMDEFNAVHVENLLRAQWHLPLRTNYGPQPMINRGAGQFSSYFYGQNGYYFNQINYQRHYSGPHSGR